jgi:hypothetical protein
MVSLIGVHFVPFALERLVEKFTGKRPFDVQYVEERRAAVRRQVRDMVVGTKG